jgi:hypothetical protein
MVGHRPDRRDATRRHPVGRAVWTTRPLASGDAARASIERVSMEMPLASAASYTLATSCAAHATTRSRMPANVSARWRSSARRSSEIGNSPSSPACSSSMSASTRRDSQRVQQLVDPGACCTPGHADRCPDAEPEVPVAVPQSVLFENSVGPDRERCNSTFGACFDALTESR